MRSTLTSRPALYIIPSSKSASAPPDIAVCSTNSREPKSSRAILSPRPRPLFFPARQHTHNYSRTSISLTPYPAQSQRTYDNWLMRLEIRCIYLDIPLVNSIHSKTNTIRIKTTPLTLGKALARTMKLIRIHACYIICKNTIRRPAMNVDAIVPHDLTTNELPWGRTPGDVAHLHLAHRTRCQHTALPR